MLREIPWPCTSSTNAALVELAALVGVDDLRLPITANRVLQRLDTKVRRQRRREPPGQDSPGRPVHDADEIDEAAGHRDVRDIERPDLIGLGDRSTSKQIRKDLVARMSARRVLLAIQGLDAHRPHQRPDMAAPDLEAFSAKEFLPHPAPGIGCLQMQPVDRLHQF